jgi:hypothetical protein
MLSHGSIDKHVDALLASYKATKDEIARRSTLQWAIIAAEGYILYHAFDAILKTESHSEEALAWSIATWAVSAITLLFHWREQMEIMRLSHVVSDWIERDLRTLISPGAESVLFERWGLNTQRRDQVDRLGYKQTCATWLERVFQIAVFLGGPMGLTFFVVSRNSLTGVSPCLACCTIMIILGCFAAITIILSRSLWPECENSKLGS